MSALASGKKKRTSLAVFAAALAGFSFLAGFVPLGAYHEIATVVGVVVGPMCFMVCSCLIICEITGDGPIKKGMASGKSAVPRANYQGMTITFFPSIILLIFVAVAVVVVEALSGLHITGAWTHHSSPTSSSHNQSVGR